MDVQTENTDPPPGESQPSGKIRKGFKLFGKRKPGNIFSIRSKGEGNNKSPVIRSKTLDGLSETPAPDSEQEPDKEKGQEVNQGETEQAEEEPLGDDGVLAAAPARTSISSASSAKSLGFLSLLRGGRRGVGDRRVHTVSQPVGRQRRGLKGLFGNVKFRSKDKEDKEEAPPSPLLMSSRANSVEIIKEDLPLTPKSQPRSLDSPETESSKPLKSFATQDSATTSPSKSEFSQVTTGNVSKTNEHVPPLSTPEPPLVPGDTSLSSLLADISSLLTFDSISGGDIMADVEAEWGKASSAISAAVTEATPSSTSLFFKPAVSSPLSFTADSTAAPAKPSPVAFPTTASPQSFSLMTKTTTTSSPISKPSSIITTFTKSSTLTTHSVKPSSGSAPASESSTSITMKSTPATTATKPSTAPVTSSTLSAPVMSSPSITIKSEPSSSSSTTTAPPNTPATVVKAPSVSPILNSTSSKLASEIAPPPQITAPVSKPIPVVTPSLASAKPPLVTHGPPIPVTTTQPPSAKLDSASSLNLQTSTSYKPYPSSVVGESKVAETVSPPCTVTTKPLSPALAPTSTITSSSVSAAFFKPTPTSTPINLNKTPPLLVTVPDICPSTMTTTTKTLPSPASVPPPSSTSLDKTPPMTKPTSAPITSDKMPPTPTPIPAPTTHAAVSTASPAPTALGQIPVSQSKAPTAPTQIPVSVSKDLPAPVSAQMQVSQFKTPPSPVQIPVSISEAPPAPAQIPVSVADTPAPVCEPISVSRDTPAPAQIPVSQTKAPPGPITVPCPATSLSALAPGPARSTGTQGVQAAPFKTEELQNESQTSLQGPFREKKTPQVKATGLSKIPVVGGGRVGKIPVRDSQHADEEPIRDPPTPVLEDERMGPFNSHDTGSKDKIGAVEAKSPTSKHSPEESQQQSKVLTSSARDSKIPVKHGAQSHTASQIPQTKEPPRTKIPVSKVPVRRAGSKPASTGSSTQMRK